MQSSSLALIAAAAGLCGCLYEVADLRPESDGGSGATSTSATNQTVGAGAGGSSSVTVTNGSTTTGAQTDCGDSVLSEGEACDDGNLDEGDGCSPTCMLSGTDCGNAIPVPAALGSLVFVPGSISGTGTLPAAAGACSSGGYDGPERVFVVNPVTDGFLTAWLDPASTSFNSTLYVSTSCAAGPLDCDADPGVNVNGGEVVSVRVTAGTPHYLVVDSSAADTEGSFALAVSMAAGDDCNDPVPIPLFQAGRYHILSGEITIADSPDGDWPCLAGNPGRDVVYRVDRMFSGKIDVNVDSATFAPALAAEAPCGGSTIACEDGQSSPTITIPPGTTSPFFVWVEGQLGSYALTIQ